MSRIFGYGEDSLTYWALTTRLSDLLGRLQDDTPPERCSIVYRPSFGRAGGPTSSQFGEFDAIVQTSRSTYLVESKWDHLQPAPNEVALPDVQVTRHRIFQWIRRKWTELRPTSWPEFLQVAGIEFARDFDGRTLANPGTLLARNCAELLTILADGPPGMTNVLLYFTSRGDSVPHAVLDHELQPLAEPFVLCVLPFPGLNDSGYIQMQPA